MSSMSSMSPMSPTTHPDTVILIDGMYLLFSSFYANRNMRTLKGEATGATFGFVTRIEALIRDLQPQHLGVAFDSREKTFRHEMYEPYKAKRLAPPEELLEQIPRVKAYLNLRGIHLFELPGFEADDIIAVCAKTEAAKGNRVLIFTADKDLFQLVGENIYIYHPKLKEQLDAQGIKEHFGVSPGQVVDFLSLTGDSSDNIPGIPGVGEKTALKILDQFGTLDNLLQNLETVEDKLKKKIQDNLEILNLSRKLVDLAYIPEMNTDFRFEPFTDHVSPALLEFFREQSFNSLLKRFEESAPGPGGGDKTSGLEIRYEVVKTIPQLQQLKERILRENYFAFDLETTAVEFFNAQIVGISISFNDGGYYIPFLYNPADGKDIAIGWEDFKAHLEKVFTDPKIEKTGHNLKFDILHLKHHGLEVEGAKDDSMVMSYLLYPNRRAHNLKDLTLEFLNYKQVEYDNLVGKGKAQKQLIMVDTDTVARYCIDDSYLSLKLVDILGKAIREKGLETLYAGIEMPLIQVLKEMEFVGVKIDVDFLKRASKTMEEKISLLEQEIYEMAGMQFNLNSSQQLGELLFDKMNLPVQKRTRKTKSYSTDVEVLNELKDFPIVSRIIDYRTYKKLLSTYLVGLLDNVDTFNRVHSSFNQTITATGRLSSSFPNLQNIPVGETGGINVRDAFVSEGDRWLLAADYSQIELRVMAHFSEDPNMMEAFVNDFDIHQHTADTVFADDMMSTPKEKRKRAKIINFSVLYGTGPFSLSKELGVGYKEAKAFIDMYFEKNAGVKRFIDEVIAKAEKEPEVRTILGRRRDIPEILSSNRTVKENGNRMAINTVIQGSAADIIKIAMVNLHQKMRPMKSKLIMQVHDELVFEYPPEEEEQLFRLVKQEMENAIELKVPLKVDLEKGKTWGTMEKVKV